LSLLLHLQPPLLLPLLLLMKECLGWEVAGGGAVDERRLQQWRP
jgi:hypothetical protein